jgi:oligopeptide transport system substrate-binding protein
MKRLDKLTGATLVAAIALIVTGCAPTPQDATATALAEITPTVEPTTPPPLILKVSLGRAPRTLDPALIGPTDMPSNDLVANLFTGLVTLNGDTGEILPALANGWETPDGVTWSLSLRNDVAWVQINASTGQLEQKRIVTAGDAVAAVRRACLHATGTTYIRALSIIKGCTDVYSKPAAEVEQTDLSQIGVKAVDDTTLEFTLTEAAGYFPAVLATPVFTPVPAELVEADPADWTRPDHIWTSGAFTVQPSVPVEQGYQLLLNPAWPFERAGNVEGVQITFDAEGKDSYTAWQNGDLALTLLPASELASAPFDSDPRYRLLAEPAVVLLALSYETPPFDNPDVRRALALATDRDAILRQAVLPNGESGLAVTSLIPPGSADAPAYGSTGAGMDVEGARAALAAAGYSGCRRLPQVNIMVDDQPMSKAIGEALAAQWSSAFGCPVGVIQVVVDSFQNVQTTMREPVTSDRIAHRAGVILLGWQAEYPAAHHWLADIIGCPEKYPFAYLNQARPCGEVDSRIGQVSGSTDPRTRMSAYEAIEKSLFDASGEMPVIPLFVFTRAVAAQSWLEVHPLRAGPLRFDQWVVSQ